MGGTAYGYDGNGNLADDGSNTFTYDAKNRLIQAVNPQHTSTYAYDALDRRVAKTVDSLTTKFLLDGLMEIAEYDGPTDALLLRYVYGPGMTAPLAEVSAAGNRRFLHGDAIGSVVAVTGDGSGGGGVVDPQILAQATATPQGGGNLTVPDFAVSAGDDRVLLVALGAEFTKIDGVTFGGAALTQVGRVVNDRNTVALYELREAALGPGAQTGDLVVDLSNTTGGGVQVTAWTLTGIDQSAGAVLSEAFNGSTNQTTINASVTTSAESSIVVSAFGLGDPITWAPGAGETQVGYVTSDSAAGGTSTEVVGPGNHEMNWSGSAARRPTLLLAAYAAIGSTPPDVLGAQTVPWEGEGDVVFTGYTMPAGDDRVLLVAVSNEDGTIEGVTFAGKALSQVRLVANGLNDVALYELREAALGAGAQSGDILVQMSGVSNDGRSTHAVAITVAGVDQAAAPLLSQAFNPGAAETSIAASVGTDAAKSLLVSAISLGDQVTWTPGTGETQVGYVAAGTAAGGASYKIVGAGSHDMNWSGSAARRPTLLVVAYAAAPAGGGGSPGNVVERYAYGPHGEGLDEGLGNIAFRYAGHRYDAETGLIYMRARYYSVAIGRFLSPDPIGYADGFNLYTYVANSPLNFIDPTGLAGQFAAEGIRPLTQSELASQNPLRQQILYALRLSLDANRDLHQAEGGDQIILASASKYIVLKELLRSALKPLPKDPVPSGQSGSYNVNLLEHESPLGEGHTIKLHIAKTLPFLWSRVKGGLPGERASSFFSLSHGTAVINMTLNHDPGLANFLGTAAPGDRRIINAGYLNPVGYSVTRGRGYQLDYAVRIVLIRNPSYSEGFNLLTAYTYPKYISLDNR